MSKFNSNWNALRFAGKQLNFRPLSTKLPSAQRDAIIKEEIVRFRSSGQRPYVEQRDLVSVVRGMKTLIEAAAPQDKDILEKSLAIATEMVSTNSLRQSIGAQLYLIHQGQTNPHWGVDAQNVAKAVYSELIS